MLEKLTLDGWDLREKLLLAFVLTALLVAATGALGFWSASAVYQNSQSIDDNAETVQAIKELVIAIEREEAAVNAAVAGDVGAHEEFRTATSNFERWADRIDRQSLDREQRRLFRNLKADHEQYTELAQQVFDATQAGNTDQANDVIETRLDPLVLEMRGTAYSLEGLATEDKQTAKTQAATTAATTQTLVLVLTVSAFAVAIAIGLFVSNRLTTPINQLSESAIAISTGTFDTDVDDHVEDDEIGRMVDAFGEMRANLEGVFADLDDISQNLETGTLQQDVDTDYPGTYGDIMQNIDNGTTQLTESFAEISEASANLRAGKLDHDIDADRPGTYGAVLSNLDQDLRQQKERERELQRQKEQLEDFATIVAHDLRNPLTVAEGRLDVIERQYASAECPQTAEQFAAIEQAHRRMETLIDDMLSLARVGNPIGEKSWVNVSDVAYDAWKATDTSTMTLRTIREFEVRASRERLQQLFENLFGNVSTHAGEDVTVTVGPIDALATTTRDSRTVSSGFFVADDGSGFEQADTAKLFEPGYSTSENGTGYGLWIVQTIVDAHEWDIQVQESDASGAKFEIRGARLRDSSQ